MSRQRSHLLSASGPTKTSSRVQRARAHVAADTLNIDVEYLADALLGVLHGEVSDYEPLDLPHSPSVDTGVLSRAR